jgi:hypothetical protein
VSSRGVTLSAHTGARCVPASVAGRRDRPRNEGRVHSGSPEDSDWAHRASQSGLGSHLPHLHRDWPTPPTSAPGLGPTPATSAPGLGSPIPRLHWDWAHPCRICTGTRLTPFHVCTGLDSPHPMLMSALGLGSLPATSAPGPGSPFRKKTTPTRTPSIRPPYPYYFPHPCTGFMHAQSSAFASTSVRDARGCSHAHTRPFLSACVL